MNSEADYYASTSQRISNLNTMPTFEPPTFFMNNYTFHREGDGYIESNISYYIETYTALFTARELSIGHGYRMFRECFDNTTPPPYPYLRALSSHSATVQLYARTADVLHARGRIDDYRCTLGCSAIGDAHHLFVNSTTYEKWRETALIDLLKETEKKLGQLLKTDENNEKGKKKDIVKGVLNIAKSLFIDDPKIWSLHNTSYYLGNQPCLSSVVNVEVIPSEILRRRVTTNIMMDWHTRCIKLDFWRLSEMDGSQQRLQEEIALIPES